MRRKAAAKVASAAVTHTQLAVEDELGWVSSVAFSGNGRYLASGSPWD